MRKPTLRQQLEASLERERAMRNEIERLLQELGLEKIKVRCAQATERRFDQLLEGMCYGMREASFPRRPQNG